MKRLGAEADLSPPNEPKKICSTQDTIASLLAKIESVFHYREKTKEEALTKWEQEGTFPFSRLFSRHQPISSVIWLIVRLRRERWL